MAREKTSVLSVCMTRAVEHHGAVKGARVAGRMAAFVWEWAQYQADTGHSPGTALEYGRWAHVPERTAFRRLAEFRELFPEDETPAHLASYVDAPRARKSRATAVPA